MSWRAGLGLVGAAVLLGSFVQCNGEETGEGGAGGQGASSCEGGGLGTGAYPAVCATCHGTEGNPAPPPDTMGLTETIYPSVGAHQSHAQSSNWHRDVPCQECHPMPTADVDPASGVDPCTPTHANATVEIEWGPVAQQGTYDAPSHTCTNVYCHGATLQPDGAGGGPTERDPDWTDVTGMQVVCGTSCHTKPPGGTHDIIVECETCHAEVISHFDQTEPAASTWADRSKHIDAIHQYVGGGGAGG